MYVHMYDMQDSQCPDAVSLKAIHRKQVCQPDGKTPHQTLCYTCMFVCALQIIYIYIKSI